MTDVFVDHLFSALGERTCHVTESAAAGLTLSSADDLAAAGFVHHHVCSPGTTAYDLAARAVQPVRAVLDDVDAIVYATCLPHNGNVDNRPGTRCGERDVKHLMRFPASLLQCELGLDGAFVLGINQQACTGMLGSLRVARALLTAEEDLGALLCLTSDRFPEGYAYEQAYNLISDGAAGGVVSRRPGGFAILACHQLTNGAMVSASDDETVGSYFTYTHQLIATTMAKAGLHPRDLDWVVPQNTHDKAWQIMARLLHLDPERIYAPTLPEAGHVISGDNILNLQRLVESGDVRRGDRVLLVMAGYGMNWQATLLERV